MQPFIHIWQDDPKDYAKSTRLFGNSSILQERDHDFFRDLLGYNNRSSSKRLYDWVFSKEVCEAVEDCVNINNVISKSLEGVISCHDWSVEGTQHFYGDHESIECHYVQCSIHFPNFKEFLRFKYNMSVACGRKFYRYRVKDLMSKAIYDGSTVICGSFEDFLSNFLEDVGANSKNLWDDGSNNYALFYGEDEVGVIYNESPCSGVVHYYINVPIPVIGTPEEISGSSCKLSVFAKHDDTRPSVQVLHPVKSRWLDNM